MQILGSRVSTGLLPGYHTVLIKAVKKSGEVVFCLGLVMILFAFKHVDLYISIAGCCCLL